MKITGKNRKLGKVELPYCVYQLVDPRDGEVFYIGKAFDVGTRPDEKDRSLWLGRDHGKCLRILDIIRHGRKVTIQVVSRHASEREAAG